jgi:hypothetical protein
MTSQSWKTLALDNNRFLITVPGGYDFEMLQIRSKTLWNRRFKCKRNVMPRNKNEISNQKLNSKTNKLIKLASINENQYQPILNLNKRYISKLSLIEEETESVLCLNPVTSCNNLLEEIDSQREILDFEIKQSSSFISDFSIEVVDSESTEIEVNENQSIKELDFIEKFNNSIEPLRQYGGTRETLSKVSLRCSSIVKNSLSRPSLLSRRKNSLSSTESQSSSRTSDLTTNSQCSSPTDPFSIYAENFDRINTSLNNLTRVSSLIQSQIVATTSTPCFSYVKSQEQNQMFNSLSNLTNLKMVHGVNENKSEHGEFVIDQNENQIKIKPSKTSSFQSGINSSNLSISLI